MQETMSHRNPNVSTERVEHKHTTKEQKTSNIASSSSEITKLRSTSPDTCSPRKKGDNIENGRERLKRHRVEVAGRVWIPDMWGQEGLLKDWIDCTAFDATLMNSSIMSARAAMMEEAGRRRTSANPTAVPHVLRLENSC